jgi:hypothetical protein
MKAFFGGLRVVKIGHAKGIDIAKERGFYYAMKEGVLCNQNYSPVSESQLYFLPRLISLPGNNNDP